MTKYSKDYYETKIKKLKSKERKINAIISSILSIIVIIFMLFMITHFVFKSYDRDQYYLLLFIQLSIIGIMTFLWLFNPIITCRPRKEELEKYRLNQIEILQSLGYNKDIPEMTIEEINAKIVLLKK